VDAPDGVVGGGGVQEGANPVPRGLLVAVLEELVALKSAAATDPHRLEVGGIPSSTAALGAKLQGIDAQFELQSHEQLAAAKAAIEKRMYDYQREASKKTLDVSMSGLSFCSSSQVTTSIVCILTSNPLCAHCRDAPKQADKRSAEQLSAAKERFEQDSLATMCVVAR
jgi:hypothetical protein